MASKGAAYGIPGRRVDGTDVIEVYHELSEALTRARSGGGPTLLEFLVYRMTPHSSSDDPTRYQPKDWSARAQAHDPFLRLAAWLATEGILDETGRARIAAEVEEQVRDAVRVAEETAPPTLQSLTEDVYARPGSVAGPPGSGRGK
jgi:TPP-dependent pyruvate/acetoin dehydrogenase alpha subunit